jgi:hypothetical protein
MLQWQNLRVCKKKISQIVPLQKLPVPDHPPLEISWENFIAFCATQTPYLTRR